MRADIEILEAAISGESGWAVEPVRVALLEEFHQPRVQGERRRAANRSIALVAQGLGEAGDGPAGDFEEFEGPGHQLDAGFEFFGDDAGGPSGFEGIDLEHVAGASEDRGIGRLQADPSDNPPGGQGVGDCHDDQARLFDPEPGKQDGPGGVAEMNMLLVHLGALHCPWVVIDDDVGDIDGLEQSSQGLPRRPVTDDHHAPLLQVGLGLGDGLGCGALFVPPSRRRVGDPGGRPHDEGTGEQAENRAREHHLVVGLAQEICLGGGFGEYECELAGLGEGEPRQKSDPQVVAQEQSARRGDDPRLENQCDDQIEKDQWGVVHQGLGFEEHSDGGKKDPEHDPAQGNNLAKELLGVGGRSGRDPGQEGADGEGQAEFLGEKSRPQHDQQGEQAE